MASNEKITVTWGKESFWPTRSNGFDVGPIVYETEVKDDETVKDAVKRAYKALESVADRIFVLKRNAFMERVEASRQ